MAFSRAVVTVIKFNYNLNLLDSFMPSSFDVPRAKSLTALLAATSQCEYLLITFNPKV